MRKIVLYIASSLDGFISRKDGSIDWLPEDEEIEEHGYEELMDRVDTLLMGRKTYEQVLSFGNWPYSGKKCYVFSNKELKKDDNVEFVRDAEFVKDLKKEEGKDIWLVGGGSLNNLLANEGLIDEVIVTIIPVVLGEGVSLFGNLREDVKLDLVESREYKPGLVQLTYKIR